MMLMFSCLEMRGFYAVSKQGETCLPGNHQSCAVMIPVGNILLSSTFRWYRYAQPPATYRLSLTGNAYDNLSFCIFDCGRAGELPLDVTNLRILPGMGKIEFTAGSPGWGTRGERCPHNNATHSGLSQQEMYLRHGYAFGITRG